ncbi:hypothetical protein [Streptomyces sp. NPDC048436]|uniref:hypothetical protein n=1 Tax=Streptomyces sp. NPDC048436 TaxID=3365550 RepID=UPI0037174A47
MSRLKRGPIVSIVPIVAIALGSFVAAVVVTLSVAVTFTVAVAALAFGGGVLRLWHGAKSRVSRGGARVRGPRTKPDEQAAPHASDELRERIGELEAPRRYGMGQFVVA